MTVKRWMRIPLQLVALLTVPSLLSLAACAGTTAVPPQDRGPAKETLNFFDGPSIFLDGPASDLGPASDHGGDRGASDGRVDGGGVNPCVAKTSDGIPLNPGCDTEFQAMGPTAIGQFIDPGNGKVTWIFTTKTKFWLFDTTSGSSGAFVAGGRDLAQVLRGLAPTDCSSKVADGTALNPGCDPMFQTNGPTSLGTMVNPVSGKQAWLFTAGPKFWLYEPVLGGGADAFVAAGKDVAQTTLQLQPANCTQAATDGTPLNPGCDVGYQANGPTAWGEFTATESTTGPPRWLFLPGPRYWIYDPAAAGGAAFVTAGADLSAELRKFTPACTVTSIDGLPLNAGCEPIVQTHGPTAAGEFVLPGSTQTVWLFTAGAHYWILDPSAKPFAFIGAGRDLAALARKLAP